MSRSNPDQGNKNPSKRWFQWEAGLSAGHFSWWDKENSQRMIVEAPFVFAVLDVLGTVTGYSKAYKKGLYSNELHLGQLAKVPLHVQFHGGPDIAKGVWKDIKETVTSKTNGGQFANSVYIATHIDGELQIANIRMKGASLGAWMDFEKQTNIYEGAVIWKGETKPGQTGSVEYLIPVFETKEVSEETANRATELDKELQTYLSEYLSIEPDKAEASIDRRSTTEMPPEEMMQSGYDEDAPF